MNVRKFNPRLILVLILSFCLLGFAVPQLTFASKALPSHITILLGFKERYGADNKLHYGIDVYAEKGTELYAPVSGTISFVGRVPGSAGLNVTALTITTEVGHQISINPFATTKVKVGDVVEKGQTLGTVSDVGDPSSAESHFHLSLREKGAYKDPTHLLMETISNTAEGGGKSNNAAAATAPPASKQPANSSTTTAPSPVTQTQSQVQTKGEKTEVKTAKTAASSVGEAATSAGKAAATVREKESNTAPSNSAQATSADEQKKTQRDVAKAQNLALFSSNGESASSANGSNSANGNEAANAVTSTSKGAETVNNDTQRGLVGELSAKSRAAHFEDGQLTAQVTSPQETILQFGQAANSSLRAEIVNHLSQMSQGQLAAIFFALAAFVSCAGLGVWRTIQLMGFDFNLAAFKKSLALTPEKESE